MYHRTVTKQIRYWVYYFIKNTSREGIYYIVYISSREV